MNEKCAEKVRVSEEIASEDRSKPLVIVIKTAQRKPVGSTLLLGSDTILFHRFYSRSSAHTSFERECISNLIRAKWLFIYFSRLVGRYVRRGGEIYLTPIQYIFYVFCLGIIKRYSILLFLHFITLALTFHVSLSRSLARSLTNVGQLFYYRAIITFEDSLGDDGIKNCVQAHLSSRLFESIL